MNTILSKARALAAIVANARQIGGLVYRQEAVPAGGVEYDLLVELKAIELAAEGLVELAILQMEPAAPASTAPPTSPMNTILSKARALAAIATKAHQIGVQIYQWAVLPDGPECDLLLELEAIELAAEALVELAILKLEHAAPASTAPPTSTPLFQAMLRQCYPISRTAAGIEVVKDKLGVYHVTRVNFGAKD